MSKVTASLRVLLQGAVDGLSQFLSRKVESYLLEGVLVQLLPERLVPQQTGHQRRHLGGVSRDQDSAGDVPELECTRRELGHYGWNSKRKTSQKFILNAATVLMRDHKDPYATEELAKIGNLSQHANTLRGVLQSPDLIWWIHPSHKEKWFSSLLSG